MKKVYLLDCTLRDGGYVNDWCFGQKAIENIKLGLEEAGVDIIELGFLRDCQPNPDRSVFTSGEDIHRLMGNRKDGVLYSAMIDGAEPWECYPIEKLGTPESSGIDYIRICVWKRLMKEHLEYCKIVAEKGFRVSIQPTAVHQYNKEEFIDLLKYSNNIHPYAVYIVDTWGTQSSVQVERYIELAERYLDKSIKIGYHGHNNKMQALSCAEAILRMNITHDICLDASIMGMGRGIGNLQTEIIIDHLNTHYSKNYDKYKIVELFQNYIKQFYQSAPWGYTMYHYLSALFNCSPDFATYFKRNGYGESNFIEFLESLSPQEKIVFNETFVEERLKQLASRS